MNTGSFSVGDAVRTGWEIFKGNWVLYVILILISFVVSAVASAIDETIGIRVFSYLAQAFLNLGFTVVAWKSIKGEHIELRDFFATYPLYPVFLVSSIVMMFAVGTGAILLIIPGVYLGIRLQFFGFIIVDTNTTSVNAIPESLERSWDLTKGRAGKIFLFDLAMVGIIVLGAILLGIGLLAAIPVTVLAMAYVYRALSEEEPSAVAVDPVSPGAI